MSLRLEMLQVARLAPLHLRDSSALVIDFLHSQLNRDGGFKNRAGESDLYYTVFGIQSLQALRAEVPTGAIREYLRSFDDSEKLDLVHTAALARCRAGLSLEFSSPQPRSQILARIEHFRSRDGGYNERPGAEQGTAYACFLALGAYQDLQGALPTMSRLAPCLDSLRAADGGYANHPGMEKGATTATAAAVMVLRQLTSFGAVPARPGVDRLYGDAQVAEWLRARCCPEGGFFASPDAPLPDLLSTATALHALSGLGAGFDDLKETCLNFLDSLWCSRGSFYAHWADEALDCEYTYYGLLALGHLAV